MDSQHKLSGYDSQGEDSSFSYSENNGVFYSHFTKSVRPLIELIDSLRLIGIDKEIGLPSIAVVGDQSSGKSSVLEALSGVALPRGSGIVTRCPLELKLRQLKEGKWSGTISYCGHKETFYDPSKVDHLVREAQDKLAGSTVGISDELISLEVSSPDVCDLTLIDLPGITRVPVHGQPDDIGDQIKSLILKYIFKRETIILVVVPCNVDIATTEALRMAQEVDNDGSRTIAILTKPDLIDKGAENDVLNIVQRKVIPLSKGYIIVRCRGQNEINNKVPLAKASQIEINFFRNHCYFSSLLNEGKASTQCLSEKLTTELVDHIKQSLPYLIEQIQTRLLDVQRELKNHEQGPPLEKEKMGPFLSTVIMKFSDQINKLSRTGQSKTENIYTLLRPEFKKWDLFLRGTETSFTEKMKDMIENYDEKHRGRELLTFSDYSEFERVIKEHVKALQEPAMTTLRNIREIVQEKFKGVCNSSFKQYPALRNIASNMITDIHSKQEAKVEKRIVEFIKMEQHVFTQDQVFQQKLCESDIKDKTKNKTKNKTEDKTEDKTDQKEKNIYENGKLTSYGSALFDSRNLIPDKLGLYYKIVYQRLTDYVPMLIILFMLKKAAKSLRHQMMELRNGADIVKLLSEESEKGRRRAELKQRLGRLKQARELISTI